MIHRVESRLAHWYIIVFALLLVVFGVMIYKSLALPIGDSSMTAFAGGTFEASGVVHVRGTDGVLFVDDDHTDEVFWMQLGDDRKQAGKITPVKIATDIIDLEGITTDGMYFYVVGSQSKSTGGDQAGLARFRFYAENQRASDTQAISGLKRFLAENVAELSGMADQTYNDGGINVEGIAWDPRGKRLLLGLRSPVVDGKALIVPLKLRDKYGAFAFDNLEVEKAITLPLGGAGIRSIEYDELRKTFRLITGAGPDSERIDFKLWEWSGTQQPPEMSETFDRRLKPEGITRISSGAQNFTFIVFDTSVYTSTD